MSVNIDKGRALEGLNMTPLIDVVFNLLIFFLVATRFEAEERELDVKLPSASEAMPLVARPKELFVNVDEQGRYYVGGEFLDARGLFGALSTASANNPGRQTVVIRADERAHWKSVVTVMDLCNKASIRDYRVATAEPERSP
jgi:biopolymer transport protein ExbD